MQRLIVGAAELLIPLDDAQIEQFETYYRELAIWNKQVNLTSITDLSDVVTKHFLDSLSVATSFSESSITSGGRLLDVGSGAGFPGVPLKIAFPDLDVVLLEATGKKVAFLDHLVRVLALDGVAVLGGRAETIAHDSGHRECYDIVVSRAVAYMPVLTELSLPFCRVGGIFIAQKSLASDDEVTASANAIETLGGRLERLSEVTYDGGEGRLVIVRKTGQTPGRYPRRPGMPAKRRM